MTYSQNRGTVFFFTATGVQNKAANVYTSWTDLIADIAGIEGEKTIVFQARPTASGPLIPAGAYDLEGITLSGGTLGTGNLQGFRLQAGTGGTPDNQNAQTTVRIDDGVTFTNLGYITNGLQVATENINSPVVTLTGSGISRIIIDNGSSIEVPQDELGGGPGFFSDCSG